MEQTSTFPENRAGGTRRIEGLQEGYRQKVSFSQRGFRHLAVSRDP
jgi:hypothetical protein